MEPDVTTPPTSDVQSSLQSILRECKQHTNTLKNYWFKKKNCKSICCLRELLMIISGMESTLSRGDEFFIVWMSRFINYDMGTIRCPRKSSPEYDSICAAKEEIKRLQREISVYM
jgi:hypothetical protein